MSVHGENRINPTDLRTVNGSLDSVVCKFFTFTDKSVKRASRAKSVLILRFSVYNRSSYYIPSYHHTITEAFHIDLHSLVTGTVLLFTFGLDVFYW